MHSLSSGRRHFLHPSLTNHRTRILPLTLTHTKITHRPLVPTSNLCITTPFLPFQKMTAASHADNAAKGSNRLYPSLLDQVLGVIRTRSLVNSWHTHHLTSSYPHTGDTRSRPGRLLIPSSTDREPKTRVTDGAPADKEDCKIGVYAGTGK